MTPRLVTTDVWAANAVGALAHQKTKAKHLSKLLEAKGLIPSLPPRIFQPRTLLIYADFTRIFASKHADFWRPTRRGFWNATTRNLARSFGRGFFGALRPIIFSISGQKNSTPKISAQISCFCTAVFWPTLPAKSGAGTEPNEGPNLGPSKALLKPRQPNPRWQRRHVLGVGQGSFHAMALGFPCVKCVWECQGLRMEVAAPTLLRRRFSRKSLWTKHQSRSLRARRAKATWEPRQIAHCRRTHADVRRERPARRKWPHSEKRRGSLTNFKLSSTFCLAKRAVHPAMMKRHSEATRPNGAQKRLRCVVWQLCLAPANLGNPASLPLLDMPARVHETRGKQGAKQRHDLPSARRLEGPKLSAEAPKTDQHWTSWGAEIAWVLARLRCTVKTHMANHARMQASLRKRRGASYPWNHQNGHPGLHPQPSKTNFLGTRKWAADKHVGQCGIQRLLESVLKKKAPVRPHSFAAGVEQGVSTATTCGKLDLCPRRQCVRCHKTLNQKPLQPHDSPVIWQLRVWQWCFDQIFGVVELCCLEDHTEATILELICCTHARPVCCREQKADWKWWRETTNAQLRQSHRRSG